MLVEHERRQRLGALDEQPVGDPLEPVAEPVGLQLRPASGERADRVVRDQLAHRTGRARARSSRSRAASTWRTRGAIRSRRPSTPGGPGVARRRGTRRRRRRAPRTRRDARPVGARVAQVDQPLGERVGRRARGPATSSSGGIGAERGDQALHRGERGRDHHERARSPRAADGSRRRGGRRSRGSGRCPRTAAPPTRAAAPTRSAPRYAAISAASASASCGPGDDRQDGRVQRAGEPAITASCARLGVRHDRPGALQQEPLERLRRDQRLRALPPSPTVPPFDPDSTNRPRRVAAGPPRPVYRADLRDGTAAGRPRSVSSSPQHLRIAVRLFDDADDRVSRGARSRSGSAVR